MIFVKNLLDTKTIRLHTTEFIYVTIMYPVYISLNPEQTITNNSL